MFRKSKKPTKATSVDVPPPPRATPTLPKLASPELEWPDKFVTISRRTDREVASQLVDSYANGGRTAPQRSQSAFATKTSFSSPEQPSIPSFHRPFRTTEEPPRISTLYAASQPPGARSAGTEAPPPPSAFRASMHVDASRRKSHKRHRAMPTFNLMVCGGQGSGKTSLLRLILDSSDLSPSATHDQRTAVENFLRGQTRPTELLHAVCAEIAETRTDKVLLSVVDTPGFDFDEGHELKLERQVSEVIKYIDALYAETMGEESKVVRENKGDQHIHLCIYMLDPTSIVPLIIPPTPGPDPPSALSAETPLTPYTPAAAPATSPFDDEEHSPPLTLRPAEVRVIQRLARRVNVVPILGRADALTEDALAAAKQAVRSSLASAKVNLGVFSLADNVPPLPTGRKTSRGDESEPGLPSVPRTISFAGPDDASGAEEARADDHSRVRGRRVISHPLPDPNSDNEPAAPESDEEAPRTVIKLRRPSHTDNKPRTRRSRSRSRLPADESDDEDVDPYGVPAIRFGASVANDSTVQDPGVLVPYTVIAPERGRPRTRTVNGGQGPSRQTSFDPSAPPLPNRHPSRARTLSTNGRATAGVDPLRGVFVRKFRWGAADSLNPAHCDFVALRTAMLTRCSGRLRARTREVLYENYRTERLLARRATNGLSREDADRLLKDLGLLPSPSAQQDEGVNMDIGWRISTMMDYNEARLAA